MVISNVQIILFIVYVASISVSFTSAFVVLMVRGGRMKGAESRLYDWGKYFLALVMMFVGISNSILLYDGWDGQMGLIEIYSVPMLLCGSLAGGVITFLALAMMRSSYVTLRNVVKHLTPGLGMAGVCLIAEFAGDGVKVYNQQEFWENISHPEYWLRLILAGIFLVQCVIYVIIFRRERKIYLSRIKGYFSDIAHLELRGVTWTFYVMICICLVTLGLCANPTIWGDMVLTFIVGVVLMTLGVSYLNYRRTLEMLTRAKENLKIVDNIKEPNITISSEGISARLDEYMRDQEAYADNGLVISDVAVAVGMNPRELSAYINRVYGVNFNAWVNAIRINAAKNMISKNSSRSLSEIAMTVGFSDLSVFSRAFKRHEELSPSAYRNRCRAGLD